MINHENVKTIQTDKNKHSNRFIRTALEHALSLGDFQKEIQNDCDPHTIASKAINGISHIVNFEFSAICLVDEQTSDMQVSVCSPTDLKNCIEEELEFMIQNGFVAWSIRERRGITVFSKDSSRQVFLHVLATYSRIRGLFIGVFPSQISRLPDTSLEIVSLILRNAANGIESLIYSTILREKKQNLEKEVLEKTQHLIRYEKQLSQTQYAEAIAELAGGVAHQFNNALTGLIGNIDLMAMKVSNSPDILRYIERTRPIIDKMSNLTSQLLAYAQGGDYQKQFISLKTLVDDVLPSVKNAIPDQVSLTLSLTEAECSLEVDLLQIRMVVISIVNNSVESIVDKGNVRIFTKVLQWHQIPQQVGGELQLGDYMCFGVEDSGVGMDGNTRSRIFEPFFSTKFAGRGLGMAAVMGIVKNHQGWISVNSKVGQGTQAHIYLPVI
jgi:signal transduction histidine kinase